MRSTTPRRRSVYTTGSLRLHDFLVGCSNEGYAFLNTKTGSYLYGDPVRVPGMGLNASHSVSMSLNPHRRASLKHGRPAPCGSEVFP